MIALRYLRPKRKDGYISVISILSLLGIMIGVAALIIVMSVMNGFRDELLAKILGLNGHVIVQSLGGNLPDFDAVAARVRKVPGVDARGADRRRAGDGLGRRGDHRRSGARHAAGRSQGRDRGVAKPCPKARWRASRAATASSWARAWPTSCASCRA